MLFNVAKNKNFRSVIRTKKCFSSCFQDLSFKYKYRSCKIQILLVTFIFFILGRIFISNYSSEYEKLIKLTKIHIRIDLLQRLFSCLVIQCDFFVHLNVTGITIPLIKMMNLFLLLFHSFNVHFPLYAFRPCATIFNTYTYIVKEVLCTYNDNRYKGMFLEREALFTLYVVKIVACEIFLFIKTCTQYLHAF